MDGGSRKPTGGGTAPAADSAAKVRWFYRTETGKSGPVDPESLCRLLVEGTLAQTAPVWCEGMASWTPAEQVPELMAAVVAGKEPRFSPSTAAARRHRRGLAAILGLVAAMTVIAYGASWLFYGGQAAWVGGVVTFGSKPVTGGSVILAPIREDKADAPGKAAVADIAGDGTYTVRLAPGSRGLTKRVWVRFSPPTLPVMGEEEAMRAVTPYLGLVPKETQADIRVGRNRVDIELVPAVPR